MGHEKITDLSYIQQDRQSIYNVTLKSYSITTVAMEKEYVLHILRVCILVSFIQHTKRNALHIIVLHGLSDSIKYFYITP